MSIVRHGLAVLAIFAAFSTLPATGDTAEGKLPPLAVKLPPAPPKPKPVEHSPDEVIVRVNGSEITWGNLNRYVDMMAALLKNKSPKISADKIAKFKKKNFKRFSDELFCKTVLVTGLADSNVVISASVKDATEREFLKNYGARRQSMAQLREAIGKAGFLAELEKALADEILVKSFITGTYSNEYYVSDERIAEIKADVAAYNERAAATNDFNRALADKIAKRAAEGEDFAALADEYSQDEEKQPGGLVGECDESDFEDEKGLWTKLSMLKPGDTTGVIEFEDGYAIYSVGERLSAEKSNTGDEALVVSRIFFRKAFLFPPQSDDEFRADVETEVRDKLFKNVLGKFLKQGTVERPNGTFDSY